MEVNFVTIKGNGNSGYEVVLMTFPRIQRCFAFGSVSESSIKKCADQKTAEVAAKEFAERKKFPYIRENTNVITSFPVDNQFLVLELTSDGKVFSQGLALDKDSSKAEATKVARKKGLPLVLPQ